MADGAVMTVWIFFGSEEGGAGTGAGGGTDAVARGATAGGGAAGERRFERKICLTVASRHSGNQLLSLAPDAYGHAAASPPSRSRMPAGTGAAAEASSGGGYAVAVASERSAADADAVFRSLQAKFRSCAAPISVPRGSITAPRLAPSCQ
jgi:hypothetical protein